MKITEQAYSTLVSSNLDLWGDLDNLPNDVDMVEGAFNSLKLTEAMDISEDEKNEIIYNILASLVN